MNRNLEPPKKMRIGEIWPSTGKQIIIQEKFMFSMSCKCESYLQAIKKTNFVYKIVSEINEWELEGQSLEIISSEFEHIYYSLYICGTACLASIHIKKFANNYWW